MSIGRKLLFSLITLGLTLLALEGAARAAWWRLEHRALQARQALGEAALRNDRVNFQKRPDPTLGYVLIPGFSRHGEQVNADGFPQVDRVPLARRPGVIRLAAMGESTTQGHHATNANYPLYLRRIVGKQGRGYQDVEVINAGVSGWISDQVALWAAQKVRPYAPDVVVLYVGWNDFQSYNPLGSPPAVSSFESTYGSARFLVDASPLKLVPLSSALYDYAMRGRGGGGGPAALTAPAPDGPRALPYASRPEETYRFYLASLDRMVAAFRRNDPKVRIAICTLVGRWPLGTEAQFLRDEGGFDGAVWWMRTHRLDREQAAASLARFNEVIRDYARSRNLLLIDVGAAFAALDRGQLQWDFAHLTAEGYELLAEVIYEGLRGGGYVRGEASPRLVELRDKYHASSKAQGG